MDLIGQEDAQVLRVPLLVPVSFSGEKKLTGVLRDGPCKDFNLIFDPHRFAARVKILGEGDTIPTVPAEAELTGILCLGTAMRCSSQHLDPLDFACLEVGDQSFTISSGESALFMTLEAARST
jgi:environmental stress-induced protein Ves